MNGSTTRARTLRGSQTDAESRLWRRLRNRRLAGCKFRRQHPLGSYIVDFACVERGLVVEVDGGQHVEQRERDVWRTRFLEDQGFRVLRFWNDQVLRGTEVVLEVIHGALMDHPSPRPSPRKRGEGE